MVYREGEKVGIDKDWIWWLQGGIVLEEERTRHLWAVMAISITDGNFNQVSCKTYTSRITSSFLFLSVAS